ncbi:MAG: tetratricopeptide repeat protein, partial [Pirellulales bacterium]|nr:tetratricopeptide repeat protein [Pirellulales bacterium]
MAVYDCRGVPVSTADKDLVAALERCHLDSLTFQGDAIASIDTVLEAAPDFVMGHCFKAGMLTQAMEVRVLDELLASVEAAEAHFDTANERERGHIAALRAWAGGDFYGAVRKWDAVLRAYPRDLLALQLVHLSNVLLGEVAGQLDCVERVIKRWDASVPGYEFVLGFHAFGLEENGAYARADERGRQAMDLRPDHPYAIHSVAHVAEMEGNQLKGIAYLNDTRKSWASSTFANHNWWHLALYHLDLGQTDRVFDIYDRHLRTGAENPETYEDLDSTALLWRLSLLGHDVGPRWRDLAKRWEPSAGDTLYAFNDVHAMMALVSGGRMDAADWLLNATARYAERASGTNAVMTRAVGLPFSR